VISICVVGGVGECRGVLGCVGVCGGVWGRVRVRGWGYKMGLQNGEKKTKKRIGGE